MEVLLQMKFNACYNDWIRNKEIFGVRYSTIQTYDSIFKNNFLNEWGNMELSGITHSLVQTKIGNMLQTHERKYVLLCIGLLSQFFEYAVNENLVPANPCSKILYQLQKQRIKKKK